MSTETYLLYIAISTGLIIIPGPNVLLIIANSLKHGSRAGLVTVAGTSTAMALQLAIVSIGISSILLIVTVWFQWLRWLGAAYLIFLGLKALFFKDKETATPVMAKSHQLFAQGFTVSLLNPKTLLFFSAFLPQFIHIDAAIMPQLLLLSVTFLLLAIIFDTGYAILSGKLNRSITTASTEHIAKLSGALLLSAGVLFVADQTDSTP